MKLDPLADYTRKQGTRILYEIIDRDIPRRVLARTESEGLGENVCLEFYSWLIKNLISERQITERKGLFSGGNLTMVARHLTSHVTVSEVVRKYEDPKKARRLCDRDHLRQYVLRYGGYLWVPLKRREEFERQLTEAYFRKK